MFLVVLFHTTVALDPDTTYLTAVNDFLRPVRMPLFFAISGMLAASAIERPLSQTRGKTLGLFYLSALWTLLLITPFVVPIPGTQDGTRFSAFGWALMPGMYWYLWALAAYFIVAKAMSSWSTWIAFLLLLLVSQASGFVQQAMADLTSIDMDTLMLSSVMANFVWFYAGVHGTRYWQSGMARARWKWALTACGTYALALALVAHFLTIEGSKLALTPFALIAANQLLAFWPSECWIARLTQWVGRKTLAIYVLHPFFVTVFEKSLTLEIRHRFDRASPIAVALMISLLAVAFTVASRMIGDLIEKTRLLRWLLSPPQWLIGSRTTRPAKVATGIARRRRGRQSLTECADSWPGR